MSDKKLELRNLSSKLVLYSSEVTEESSPIPRTPFIDLPPLISYTNSSFTNSRKFSQRPHFYIRYPLLPSDIHDFKFSKLEKRKLRERYGYEEVLDYSKRVIRQLEDCYNILKLVHIRETFKKKVLSYDISMFEVSRNKHSSEVCKAFLNVLSNLRTPTMCEISDSDLANLHIYSQSKPIPIQAPRSPPFLPILHSFSALKKPAINPLSVLKTPQNNLIFDEDTSLKLPIRTTYKLLRVYRKSIILDEQSSSSSSS